MTEQSPQPATSFEDAFDVAVELQPAMNKLMMIFHRTAEDSTLTTSQISIMNQLRRRGASRVSSVAKAEMIRMPTASNALYQLETRGLVKRMRDEQDRRGVLVALTEEGEKELQKVSQQRAAALADILRWLSPEQLDTARQVTAIINNLAADFDPEQVSQ